MRRQRPIERPRRKKGRRKGEMEETRRKEKEEMEESRRKEKEEMLK